MKIKIKKIHPNAVIPSYAKTGDAGMDLTAVDVEIKGSIVTYKTGLAVEIPDGFAGFLFPRSSVYKKRMIMTNCVGVVDSGYRGEIMLKYLQFPESVAYNTGDRVGQLIIMPYPEIEFEEVDNLTSSERGDGGYGSTGV